MDISSLTSCNEISYSSDSYFFTSELDLVDKFEIFLIKAAKEDTYIEREFDGGFGIADAVLFEFSKKKLTKELAELAPEWVYTLRMLPYRKVFSIEHIQTLSGSSTQSCRKAIKNFIDCGFCQQKTKNKYIKIFQPKSFINKTVAIEAKLKNWKRALFQASRYKTFSNQSWVLMDSYHARPAILNIESFKQQKVGLASFSTTGKFVCHFKPPVEKPYSEIAYWRSSTLLARALFNNSRPTHDFQSSFPRR